MKKIITFITFLILTSLSAQTPLTLKLNMYERFVASSLLPEKASFSEWKIINDLKNELAPTEAELKAIDLKPLPDAGGVTANWGAVKEKEIVFGETTERIIVNALKKLDKESGLLVEHLSLYEKFVKEDQ